MSVLKFSVDESQVRQTLEINGSVVAMTTTIRTVFPASVTLDEVKALIEAYAIPIIGSEDGEHELDVPGLGSVVYSSPQGEGFLAEACHGLNGCGVSVSDSINYNLDSEK